MFCLSFGFSKKDNNDLIRFKKFDKFVDQYHTISLKSMNDIQKITDRHINLIDKSLTDKENSLLEI